MYETGMIESASKVLDLLEEMVVHGIDRSEEVLVAVCDVDLLVDGVVVDEVGVAGAAGANAGGHRVDGRRGGVDVDDGDATAGEANKDLVEVLRDADAEEVGADADGLEV